MPRYRFQVTSARGKERKGKITAPDIDAARRMLNEAGFQVQTLTPMVEVTEQRATAVRLEGRERRGYRPGWTEKVIDFEPDPFRLKAVIGCVIVAGLLLMGVDSARQSNGPAKPTAVPDLKEISVRLTGQVEQPDAGWDGTKLVFHLPQVPLDIERSAEEVLGESGRFTFDYSFKSRRAPVTCSLTVEKKGWPPVRSRPETLTGEPLSAEFDPVALKPD